MNECMDERLIEWLDEKIWTDETTNVESIKNKKRATRDRTTHINLNQVYENWLRVSMIVNHLVAETERGLNDPQPFWVLYWFSCTRLHKPLHVSRSGHPSICPLYLTSMTIWAVFSRMHATLHLGLLVGPSVGPPVIVILNFWSS